MSQATITAKIHESFYIHGYFPAQVTFNLAILINALSDTCYFRFGKIFSCRITINFSICQ